MSTATSTRSSARARVPEAVLLDFPLRLGKVQAERFTEIKRELDLVALAAETGEAAFHSPQALIDLSVRVAAPYICMLYREAWRQQVCSAADGLDRIDIRYPLIPETAAIAADWVAAMDLVDEYCEQGRLLLLPSPVELRRFRQWHSDELCRQAEGLAPEPWPGPW